MNLDDEHGHHKFGRFASTTAEVEFASKPTTFQEAWNHPDPVESEGWRDTIKKKFKRTIGSKWMFERKRDGRFRAKLCGLGYTQIAIIDFAANYAPVVRDITFKTLSILKMLMVWDAELINIETAFLHGEMEKLIFMNLPKKLNFIEGIEENGDTDCVILDKCIYETVQVATVFVV